MNDHFPFENPSSDPHGDYAKLVPWLLQVLKTPPSAKEKTSVASESDTQLSLLLDSDYHLHFYQQLPDFAEALLTNDPQATVHYAPLLYHLAGCSECHSAYLDLYDAMRAAIVPQGPRPLLGQGTRTLSATPQRMLGHLCQLLISQAEAVLTHRHHTDNEAMARSLLQLTLRISARITQQSIRRLALHDLVRVATLFNGSSEPKRDDLNVFVYTPTLVEAGGRHASKKIVRRADASTHSAALPPEQAIISLQSHSLEGSIVQREYMLELHLQNLGEEFRGRNVTVSVPLGALIEPVRWVGGNPSAIHSTVPVDASGMLIMPLGQTELQLSNQEERNLLEAMFMLLEVYPAN